MKVIIACGGSGGHIFPGIALACELAKKNDILIVCSSKPLDAEILKRSGYNFEIIPYNPFVFTLSPLRIFLFLVKLIKGSISSVKLLLKFRPDCVVGFGGFVSGPVIFAAWLLRIPRIIHEQNLIAGLANRVEALFANRVAVSFEDTKRFFNKYKAIKVGNPVRGNFLNLDKAHSRDRFGLDRDRFTLFIAGGSQGSSFLNNIAIEALKLMDHGQKKTLQVIHITGRTDYQSVKQIYIKENIKSKPIPFLDEIDRAYTASDLVIARAGATTIAELTYFAKPSILIPYPERRVHQIENAHFLSNNNAAMTIEEKDLNAEGMKDLILDLIKDAEKLKGMSKNSKRLSNPSAASLLAEEVLSLAGGI